MAKTGSFSGRDLISAYSTIVVPFFRSESRKKAWALLSLLLGLLILVSTINVGLSYVGRDFISALSDRKPDDFYRAALIYASALVLATLVAVVYRFTEEKLALAWREWMTQHLLKKYFFRRSYYNLRLHEDIDNPDQRIAEDVKNVTATTLSLLLIFLNSLITVGAFAGVLASISWRLVLVLLVYAVLGTLFTYLIGKRLVRIYNRQYQREASFRYGLIRVRDNAESIAFFRGEPRERIDLLKRFLAVVRNTSYLIGWNRNLGFFTTGYNSLALILPTIIVAPLYLKGTMGFGVVTQATGAFAQVPAALSVLITQFERISAYTAGVFRLQALWNQIDARSLIEEDDDPEIAIEEGNRLQLKTVTVIPPRSKRILIKDLNCQVPLGTGLLIMGDSGTGKSSLLRTIAGLWSSGDGSIQRPRLKDTIFLPQRPYMPVGNLRSALMYPIRDRGQETTDLKAILKRVNLEEVLQRVEGNLEQVLDWGNVLSLGEQQRLSFARVLVAKPQLIFLDEATSALDEENESLLYKILSDDHMTFVSVGHRSTLKSFHNFLLFLEGDGKWSYSKIEAK